MKTILLASPLPLIPAQTEALDNAFGQHRLIQMQQYPESSTQIESAMLVRGADTVIVLKGAKIKRQLVLSGIFPIVPQMTEFAERPPDFNPDTDIQVRGRYFRFTGWLRLTGIDWVVEPLTAEVAK